MEPRTSFFGMPKRSDWSWIRAMMGFGAYPLLSTTTTTTMVVVVVVER